MSKKIKLSSEEEIELTDREAKIYEKGFDSGMATGGAMVGFFILGVIIAVSILT